MKTRFVSVLSCWIISSQLAYAVCSEPQPRLVCAEFSAAKIVVQATLVKVDNETYKNDPKVIIGHYYTLKTSQIYRGVPEQTVKVYEGNDSGRASFPWKVGTRYLLFLFKSHEKPNEQVLSFDGCGNSGPVARAASALRGIDQMKYLNGNALIAGTVSSHDLSTPLPDVELEARGSGKIYRASTDRKGRFRVEVPPGDYTLEPKGPDLSFEVFEMSYEDQHLAMQPGTCAQVQFLEKARP